MPKLFNKLCSHGTLKSAWHRIRQKGARGGLDGIQTGILYQRVWQAVMRAGLNPHISFLHAFQTSKPTLVYDLVEEFRQPFTDRAVFSMLTRGKKGADLRLNQKTGLLVNETRKKVTRAVLGRLSGLVTFRGKKLKGEDIIEIQARNLVSFLQDKGPYKPFIGRY